MVRDIKGKGNRSGSLDPEAVLHKHTIIIIGKHNHPPVLYIHNIQYTIKEGLCDTMHIRHNMIFKPQPQ